MSLNRSGFHACWFGLSPQRDCRDVLTVVVGFELGWWDAAEVVEDASVVEPVDPFEGGEFEVVETAPWPFVADEFCFVEAVDGLGERVVVAVAA